MKIKNNGRYPKLLKGVMIGVGEEKEVDISQKQLEKLNLKGLVAVKEANKKGD